MKILLFLVTLGLLFGCNHPSDKELEQRFYANKTDFIKLAKMLDEDNSIVVLSQENIFSTANAPRNISIERLNEFRAMLEKLKIDAGIHRSNPSSVHFIVSTKGWPIVSSQRSILYSIEDIKPLTDSLDQIIRNENGDTPIRYKKIEENWYLAYESW